MKGVLLFSLLMIMACSPDEGLKPFTSDGCSLFPDASLINADDWCLCCFEHDVAYWRGGTRAERGAADLALRTCVLDKTNNEALATLMYDGVRFGGSPYFYNWYRWGYGWPYDRKYQALSSQEREMANAIEREFRDVAGAKACPGSSKVGG